MCHVADLAADVAEVSRAENPDLATRRMVQPGEGAEERGFAGAVVAEDGVETTGREFGGDAAQGGEASELLDQVGDGDDGSDVSQWLGL